MNKFMTTTFLILALRTREGHILSHGKLHISLPGRIRTVKQQVRNSVMTLAGYRCLQFVMSDLAYLMAGVLKNNGGSIVNVFISKSHFQILASGIISVFFYCLLSN